VRYTSSPITNINENLTKKLTNINEKILNSIKRVLLSNVTNPIPLDWIEIRVDKQSILLTEFQSRGTRTLAMKGIKYRIFTLAGNKLRKENNQLSIKLIGTNGESQIHNLLSDNSKSTKEVSTNFYDKNIGQISSVVLFIDGKIPGAGKIGIAVRNNCALFFFRLENISQIYF
jgi:hypothetical protein